MEVGPVLLGRATCVLVKVGMAHSGEAGAPGRRHLGVSRGALGIRRLRLLRRCLLRCPLRRPLQLLLSCHLHRPSPPQIEHQ